MAVPEVKAKEYDYDDIFISLENCILPTDKIDETPSMKDGLDRDTENDLRVLGCEIIQTAGLLLRLPQVAMATGQVLLQRFYFSKSIVKHDVEVSAMAAIYLAAKIEENPRRLRDVINVCQHIKQRMLQKSHTPMDYQSSHYFNLKNGAIKAERRILKELGFCVHVKHPHKLIITYLQMIDHQNNVALARKAWNYMNDSLRSDVFVRFSPETIACACIFLAARTTQVNLPQRPPWYELFDATYDEIEDISLAILRLYARPRRKLAHLESIVHKIKKTKAEQDKVAAALKDDDRKAGSFTPSQNPEESNNTSANNAINASINNNNSSSKPNSRPPSRTASPTEKPEKEGKKMLSSVVSKNSNNNRDVKKGSGRTKYVSESEESTDYSSDSGTGISTKKRKRNNTKSKKRHSSSESDNDRKVSSKIRRSVSPVDGRRSKSYKDSRDKVKGSRDTNGQYDKNYSRSRKRSRSRSPVKRNARSPSPQLRKDKYYREKDRERDKVRSRVKNSGKSRR